jgi:hypothetical protein
MGNKIIYVATDGDYSDFHIVGVYESKELAEEIRGVGCDVEEWNLNTDIYERRQGLKRFGVCMDKDGNGARILDYWIDPRSPEDVIREYYKIGLRATFEMWARDQEHAIKIANERRVQLIANGQWVK